MYPTLNATVPDWASASIVMNVYDGAVVDSEDIKGITCSDSIEFGVQRGKGGKKRARGTGQLDNEASLSLYRTGHQALTRALMAVAPVSNGQRQTGLVGFDIFYQHTPPGSSEIYLVKILGCRRAGREFSGAEGPDVEVVEWPLNIMSIVEVIDGVEVVLL